MIWIHENDAWKLMVPNKHKLITYVEIEPEDIENWVKLDKIPEGAKKAGASEE